jgi:TRAP-type C4-dicarboxylate transport system substrate-binding protein
VISRRAVLVGTGAACVQAAGASRAIAVAGETAMSLPYVFDSTDHMRRSVDGAAGRSILQAFEKRGLVGLAIYDSGARCFYNHLRAVSEPGDLQGLKIRVPPSDMFVSLVRALGANPTPLGAVGALLLAGSGPDVQVAPSEAVEPAAGVGSNRGGAVRAIYANALGQ